MEGFGPCPGKHPDSVKADPAEMVKTAGCVTTGDQLRFADIRARDEEINSPGFEAPAKVPEIDWALGADKPEQSDAFGPGGKARSARWGGGVGLARECRGGESAVETWMFVG